MKIKFKFARHAESATFSTGDILILPSLFFKYIKFGKYRVLCVGVLFMQYELSISIRNWAKLIKQTRTLSLDNKRTG